MHPAIAFIIGMVIAAPISFLACAMLTSGKLADKDTKIIELRRKLDARV